MEENKYLAHYGIKGQQWGERRYRNYDGTLTAAGKARYGSAEKESESTAKSKQGAIKSKNGSNTMSDIQKKNQEIKERNKARDERMKNMDDQELRDTVNRLNMERQYHTLTDEPLYEEENVENNRNFALDKSYVITKNLAETSKNISNTMPDKKKLNKEAVERNKARNELMKKMNDQELRDTVNRLNMERQYHTLTDEPVYEDGKNTTKKIIDGFGTAMTLTATGLVVTKAVLDLIDRFK